MLQYLEAMKIADAVIAKSAMHPVIRKMGGIKIIICVRRNIPFPVHFISEVIANTGCLATAEPCLLKNLPHIGLCGIINYCWQAPVFVLCRQLEFR